MKHIEKRLNEAYKNVEYFADETWVENSSYEYCRANQVLWTRECKIRNSVPRNKFDPCRTVQDCIPESKLSKYSTYEYNDSRESSYKPYFACETAFHRFDWGYLEPWMFPEVESAFKHLIDPSAHPFARQIDFNLNETQGTCIKDGYRDLTHTAPAMCKFVEKTPGCRRFYTIAEPVTEDELQLHTKKTIRAENFAQMTLLLRTMSDKVKRIWDSSGRFRKICSVPSKKIFHKFYICDSRKFIRKPRKIELFNNVEHLEEKELFLIKNHKDRTIDFRDIQKLTSSLNAIQGWLTAMSRTPSQKEPTETPVSVLEIPKPTNVVKNRRSYSAVVQGLESDAAIPVKSPKSLESIFLKHESPLSTKTAYSSSSESDVSTKTELSSVQSPRMSSYSPRKRVVPYEQRSPVAPEFGTRWGTMRTWTSPFSNFTSPSMCNSPGNSSTSSLELETLPVLGNNPVLQELYAIQQIENSNPALAGRRTTSKPNNVPDVRQHQDPVQQQKMQQTAAPANVHSTYQQQVHAGFYQPVSLFHNVSWLPLARNTLYTAATVAVQQNPVCQNASYFRAAHQGGHVFHGYPMPPPQSPQVQVAAAAAAFHWNLQKAVNLKQQQQQEATARLLESTAYRIQQQQQQQIKQKNHPAPPALVLCGKDNHQVPSWSSNSRETATSLHRTCPVGEAASLTDLEHQALEQYSSSHESIFGQLEKQGVEQYDGEDTDSDDEDVDNSENWRCPPMPVNLFGGRPLFAVRPYLAVCMPPMFAAVAMWWYLLNTSSLLLLSGRNGAAARLMPLRAFAT